MRSIIAFFCFLGCFFFGVAQDSSERILKENLDEARSSIATADALLDLASYYSTRDTVYAVHYFDKLNRHLDANPQLTGFIPQFYVEMGVMYYYADIYEKAELYFQKAAGDPEIFCDSLTLSRLWFFTGVMDELRGEPDSALLYLRKSLSIASQSNNINQKAAALHAIASLHLEQGNVDYASEYFQKEMTIRQMQGDTAEYASALIGMGRVYEQKNEYDKALNAFQAALDFRILTKDTRRIASSYLGMGRFFLKREQPETATENFEKAITLFTTLNEKTGLAYSWTCMAKAAMKQHDYTRADSCLMKACALCDVIGNPLLKAECLLTKSEFLALLADYKNAYAVFLQYDHLNDSLNLLEKNNRISALEVKFQTEQKNLQLLKYQAQDRILRQRTIIFTGSIVLLVLILAFIIILFKNKNQKLFYRNRLLESEKEIHLQKELLLSRQKKAMEERIEYQEKELANKALSLFKTSALVEDTVEKLDDLCKSNENKIPDNIAGITNSLKNFAHQDLWEDFEHSFTKVHNDFYKKLLLKAPSLTSSEIRIASLIRLNLTTKEICAITMRSESSIKSIRFRLRKKLGLTGDDNLTAFIMQI